jgi:hypothetical protein
MQIVLGVKAKPSDRIYVAEAARNRILDLGLTNMCLTLDGKMS